MSHKSLTVLQVNTRDISGGGAEVITWSLFQSYRSLGLQSWLAVGYKNSNDPNVLLVPNKTSSKRWVRFWRGLGNKLTPVMDKRGMWQLKSLLYGFGQVRWWLDTQRGYEDFYFPGTWRVLDLLPQQPDIAHCHNLHGEYFDLQALPWLSQQVPLVLTLHDTWLLSGHCAYALDCERWKTGCGNCPYLFTYPSLLRDGTAYNWKRKQEIFAQSRLYIVTPSQWLMQEVEQSMLAPAIIKARVIPNGIDLSTFQPVDKQVVRAKLGLPSDAKILLFVASSIKETYWKDYKTMRAAVAQVAETLQNQRVIFIALGDDAEPEQIGQAKIHFIPYQTNPKIVAQYYQAADLYLHAAHVDNFPTTILESLACGTPVIATAVGGIPEQIKSLKIPNTSSNGYSADEATGVLLPWQDAQSMATAIEYLLGQEILLNQLGKNAAQDAKKRFDQKQQVEIYLRWYQEIIDSKETNA